MRLIDIQRVRPDIGKDGFGPTQGESICDRDKGERRNDYFVSRLDIQQQRGHLQRRCAGCGQKRLFHAQFSF